MISTEKPSAGIWVKQNGGTDFNNSQLRLIALGNQQGSEIQFNNVLHIVVPVSGAQSGTLKAAFSSSGLDVFGTVK